MAVILALGQYPQGGGGGGGGGGGRMWSYKGDVFEFDEFSCLNDGGCLV